MYLYDKNVNKINKIAFENERMSKKSNMKKKLASEGFKTLDFVCVMYIELL